MLVQTTLQIVKSHNPSRKIIRAQFLNSNYDK